MEQSLSQPQALAAFAARDRSADERFVVAVSTTHIYCKPSCPARRPRPEHVAIYPDPAAARAAAKTPAIARRAASTTARARASA